MNLNCERHPGLSTVGRCLECGRDICPDCIAETGDVLRCPECFSREVERIREMMGAGAKKAPRTKREKAPRPIREKGLKRKGKKAKEEAPVIPPVAPVAPEPPEFVEVPTMVVAKPEEEREELPAGPVPEPPETWGAVEAIPVEEETPAEKAIPAIEAREVVSRPPAEEVVFSAAPTADFTEFIPEEVSEESLIEGAAPPIITSPVEDRELETVPPAVEPAPPVALPVEDIGVKEKKKKPPRTKREKPPKEPKEKRGKTFWRKEKKAAPEYTALLEAGVVEEALEPRFRRAAKKPGFDEVPRVVTPQISEPPAEEAPPVFEKPSVGEKSPAEKKKLFGRRRKEKLAEPPVAEIEAVRATDLEGLAPPEVGIPEGLLWGEEEEDEVGIGVDEFGIPLKKKDRSRKTTAPRAKGGLFRKRVEQKPPQPPPDFNEEAFLPISPPAEEPPPVVEEDIPPVYEAEVPLVVEPPEIREEVEPPVYLEGEKETGFAEKEKVLEEPPLYEEAPALKEEEQEPAQAAEFYFEKKSAEEPPPFEPGGEGLEAETDVRVDKTTERLSPRDETDYGWSFDEKPPSRGEVVLPSAGVDLIEEPPKYLDEQGESARGVEASEGEKKRTELDDDLDSFFFEEEKGEKDRGDRREKSDFWD